MKTKHFALTLSLAVLLCMTSAFAQTTYSFQTVNYPGDTFTQLLGINNSGDIAGYHNFLSNSGFTYSLKTKTFTTENYPGSAMTQVIGINNEPFKTTGFTFRATALVNEAYLRLVEADVTFQDRVHFCAVSARILRRILVDYARSQNRQKRGGEFDKIPLDDAILVGPQADRGIIELDEAMQRLAAKDRRKSDLIELLFFGGLTYDEAAEALKISPATVHRELTLAKAWLHRELGQSTA